MTNIKTDNVAGYRDGQQPLPVFLFFLSILFLGLSILPAYARKDLKIVGSSTVYPYANAVAQSYAKRYSQPQPKIGMGGSGDGFKAFCAGVGAEFPDITNASRPMKRKEWKLCEKNGVDDITEVNFGNDGIALVTSYGNNALSNLTLMQLYKAIAEWVPQNGVMVRNPYRTWNEINPSLPNTVIQIYGPDRSHGTYGVIADVVIKDSCKKRVSYFSALRNVRGKREEYSKKLKKYCARPRSDGGVISLSVDQDKMFQMVQDNPTSLFFMGYATLFKNRKVLKALRINGVEPRIYTISDKSYVLSRPLFFYIKNSHRVLSPNMNLYIKEFMSSKAMNTFGYLMRMGLGGLPIEDLKKARYSVAIGRKLKKFKGKPKRYDY